MKETQLTPNQGGSRTLEKDTGKVLEEEGGTKPPKNSKSINSDAPKKKTANEVQIVKEQGNAGKK